MSHSTGSVPAATRGPSAVPTTRARSRRACRRRRAAAPGTGRARRANTAQPADCRARPFPPPDARPSCQRRCAAVLLVFGVLPRAARDARARTPRDLAQRAVQGRLAGHFAPARVATKTFRARSSGAHPERHVCGPAGRGARAAAAQSVARSDRLPTPPSTPSHRPRAFLASGPGPGDQAAQTPWRRLPVRLPPRAGRRPVAPKGTPSTSRASRLRRCTARPDRPAPATPARVSLRSPNLRGKPDRAELAPSERSSRCAPRSAPDE